MKKRKRIRRIAAGLCAILLCSLSVPASATSLSNITNQSIRDKQNQIDQAQTQIKNLQNGLTNLKQVKKNLEAQRADLQKYVEMLDGQVAEIEQKITDLKGQITQKEGEIDVATRELEDARQREEDQRLAIIEHVRNNYEKGEPDAMTLLFASDGFSDLLNRVDYIQRLAAYDDAMWKEFQANREFADLCRQQLELEHQVLDQTKQNLETEQQNLEELIDQKTADILAKESDINNQAQAIREYEADIAAQNAAVEALEAAIKAERERILRESGSVIKYDGGAFKFPLATYTRVSDDYGKRIHPILKVEQFHNGVDFASPKGTAIYAAYDGVVVASAYNSSMGNYIMIDHGDGLFTIYMHASKLYVSKDAVVKRGDTIAAVGSTGRSTGNHLHFSVRKDGEYVSPWNFLSQ